MYKLLITTMVLFISSIAYADNYYDISVTGGGSWPLVEIEQEYYVDGQQVYKKFETTLPYQIGSLRANYIRMAVLYKDKNRRNHNSSWIFNVSVNGQTIYKDEKKGMWTQSIMSHGKR